jgi:hypothetical protein
MKKMKQVNSLRVDISIEARLAAKPGRRGRIVDMPGLRVKSPVAPDRYMLVPIAFPSLWNESRNYRALVLRQARRELQRSDNFKKGEA